jgi:MFS family permease
MRRLLAVNVLYSFIVAALAVMVPLYLLDQKVDIATVGILLSIGPLSFMVIRVSLASIADEIGTRSIGVLYCVCNLLSILTYLLLATPLGFAFANLSEGIRASGFWAISRTEVLLSNSNGNPGKTLAYFSAMRQLADGFGRVFVGFILAYLAFSGAFILFFALSIAMFGLVLYSENGQTKPIHFGTSTLKRILKPRPVSFWYAAMLQLLSWLAYNMLLAFVIPVYLFSSLKMSYQETGGLMALLSLAIAGFAFLSMRWHFDKRTLLLCTLVIIPALIAFPFVGKDVIVPLLMLSFGIGCSSIVAEYILVDQIIRSKDVSTDIGVLYMPLKVAEFIFFALGGFVISQFGYAPLFFVCAVSVFLFVIAALRVIQPIKYVKPN